MSKIKTQQLNNVLNLKIIRFMSVLFASPVKLPTVENELVMKFTVWKTDFHFLFGKFVH